MCVCVCVCVCEEWRGQSRERNTPEAEISSIKLYASIFRKAGIQGVNMSSKKVQVSWQP